MKKLLLTCLTAAALVLPVTAQAQRFIGPAPGGRVAIVGGPVFVGGWYGPFWGPYGFYNGYYYAPNAGTVKFDTSVKDAEVFVNGAYAGTVKQVKTLRLLPGSYNIQLRAPDGRQYAEKIYVVAGKTLHVNPDLQSPAQP